MTESLPDLGTRLAAAAHLAPVARYLVLRDLAVEAKGVIAAEQDRAIAEATDTSSYEQVAVEAGISTAEVSRRISAYRRRTGAPSRRGKWRRRTT